MIDSKLLDEMEKVATAATSGPWTYTPAGDGDDWMLYDKEFTFVKQDDSGVPVSKEDGTFIAHSRTWIPQLIDEVRRLQKLEQQHLQKAQLEIGRRTLTEMSLIAAKEALELSASWLDSSADLLKAFGDIEASGQMRYSAEQAREALERLK